MIHALRAGNMPIVMPRRKHYGEHVDDHQLEGARALAAEGRIVVVYEPAELPAAIDEARTRSSQPQLPNEPRMIKLVSRAIEDLVAIRCATHSGCKN
jgi:UDP-N-acetylglucosamine transferase subunit ALG13